MQVNFFKASATLCNSSPIKATAAEKEEARAAFKELRAISDPKTPEYFEAFAFTVKDSGYAYDVRRDTWVLGEHEVTLDDLLFDFETALQTYCPYSGANWNRLTSKLKAELGFDQVERYLNS